MLIKGSPPSRRSSILASLVVLVTIVGCGSGGETTSGSSESSSSSGSSSATGTGGSTNTGGSGGTGGSGATGGTGGGMLCMPGEQMPCYTGPSGTEGMGACKSGLSTCNDDGTAWGDCTGEVTPKPETCDTPEDDDCNGQINEGGPGCVCTPNEAASCYSGPDGTLDVGACVAGTKLCNDQGTAWGPCTGEVLPQPETCDTPEDDDCNGQTNESGTGCSCVPDSTASCYSGPAGTEGVGACKAGTKTCNDQGTAYGPCVGEVTPVAETCNTPEDDDCNGQVNESGAGCTCVPNTTASCYSGPAGTAGVGACKAGTKTCNDQGTAYGPCVGEVLPQPETCNTPEDDDCNGQVNEGGPGCSCAPSTTASCYSGPAGTLNVGACKAGTQTCNDQGTGYGPCTGEVLPQAETCNTPIDDDCNGQTNEGGAGCVCVPSTTASCYSGPAGTLNVGACHAGTKTCNAQGTAYGPCVGEVTPVAETCNTPIDDDCNGQTNEGGAGCACAPSSTTSCYSGPAGTLGVGACHAGTKTCNAQGTAYGPCTGEVLPQTESCATPGDDDCNGQINEGCACVPNTTASCYSGPAGTLGVGACAAGTKTCNAQGTAYGPCVGEVLPQAESCLTATDDNCDGQINEGCICGPNTTTSCYSGPAGTAGVGVCKAGTKTCNAQGTAYGACTGEVLPQTESCLTSVDDNCDGQVNEGCICVPNSTASCYSGPAGTQGVGACKAGTQTCNAQGTAYGPCTGEVLPQAESCLTSVDDNCDGQVNEGCICAPNSTASCYSGPAGTQGVGACKAGTKTCNAQGTGYGACTGEVLPQAESCLTSVDDDCNGLVNEGCVCAPNSTTSCYSGPAGTVGVGACKAGTKTCNAQGTAYGACVGEVLPTTESCLTSVDDNCDGQINEGCVCAPNSTASCYSGPAGTVGVGACQAGTHTCNAQGTGYGACTGEVTPQPETCTNSIDDNCDGQVNEGGTGCVCVPSSTASCYSGPAGTQGVGACHAGTKTCNALGTGYGACTGEVTPVAETCNTPVDDDCNGQTNEGGAGCVCVPASTASCYSGPAGTQGVGACHAGTKTCNDQGTAYGACTGEVTPVAETCNTPVDDDCNGQTNEGGAGCVCVPNSTASCYSGPAGTLNVGACHAGTKTCNAQGTAYGSCVGEVTPVAETCNTPVDDDCNGQTNEGGAGCVCVPNATVSCYSGPAGTQGVGACHAGTKTCNAQGTAYGSCVGEVTPVAETCNTPVDDDCNGQTNEGGAGCVCVPNSSTSCYTGPAGTLNVGACHAGTKTCNAQGTAYGACTGEVTPTTETCNTAEDDDCNGQVNESGPGCVCSPSSPASCYSGPAGTQNVGACHGGTKTCNALGTAYGSCAGEVTPVAETCNTPVDDDCNGQTNEGGAGCVCVPVSTASCYSGPAGTQNVGACKGGTKTCNDQGTAYGTCVGEVTPVAETCNTPVDDDCNGQTNEGGAGCVCAPNSTASCYSGAAGTLGVGPCKAGTKTCNALGTAYGSCVGEVTPQPETCNTPIDDNCNGQTNEGGVGCVCTPNATTSCYSGPAGTSGVGICQAGTQTCNALGTANGACVGQVTPVAESCNTPTDDNCDGQVNESCGQCLFSKALGGVIDDEGLAITADASGNVIVGAYINGTVDFGCGPLTTTATLDGAAIAKLSSSGTCLWNKAAGDGSAHTQGVATDAAGNVYVVGYLQGTLDWGCGVMTSTGGNNPDAFVAKLNGSTGACIWSKSYGDANIQYGNSIAVDSAGNVLVAGFFLGSINLGGGALTSAGANDVFVAKLDAGGNHVWSKRYGDANNQALRGLKVDGANNVLVVGQFAGTINFGGTTLTSAGLNDAFVAKLDTNGNHVWSKRYGDASDQLGIGITTDAANNVIAVGSFGGTINFGGSTFTSLGGNDAWLVKLDAAGNHLWSKGLGGPNTQQGIAVGVDAGGYIVATGQLQGSADFGGGTLTSAGNADVWLARYDPSGNHLWSKRYGDAATQAPIAVTHDPSGNILLAGLLMGPTDFGCGPVQGGGGEDVFFTKLTP
ncbi:MAG: MopE-related protein [Minicystis sp.]